MSMLVEAVLSAVYGNLAERFLSLNSKLPVMLFMLAVVIPISLKLHSFVKSYREASDERPMTEKWRKIIGTAALNSPTLPIQQPKSFYEFILCELGLSFGKGQDPAMSYYLALESGELFPAQVYDRESQLGFMLSCYDAELCYDSKTDTFKARYPPLGRNPVVMEYNVPWERVRAPPVDTPPDTLHSSDCLSGLKPGDHFEVQWRRMKNHLYGWWYGVVGHLESCPRNANCSCLNSETVVLDFQQFDEGSQWRSMTIKRNNHGEEGNEDRGFYGGVRKLDDPKEISAWKRRWPPTTC